MSTLIWSLIISAAGVCANGLDLPCTIERIVIPDGQSISLDGADKPIIFVLGNDWNANFMALTSKASLLERFASTEVKLSSSNTYSHDRAYSTLGEYFTAMEIQSSLNMRKAAAATEKSTETFYMFGENFAAEWKSLNEHYRLPPAQGVGVAALSFGVGGFGSGVAFHFHSAGFSEVLHGAKHWLLYPPDQKFNWDAESTSWQWLQEIYPTLTLEERPMECTIRAGEILYFPNLWYHAIVNVAPYTAFMSVFL